MLPINEATKSPPSKSPQNLSQNIIGALFVSTIAASASFFERKKGFSFSQIDFLSSLYRNLPILNFSHLLSYVKPPNSSGGGSSIDKKTVTAFGFAVLSSAFYNNPEKESLKTPAQKPLLTDIPKIIEPTFDQSLLPYLEEALKTPHPTSGKTPSLQSRVTPLAKENICTVHDLFLREAPDDRILSYLGLEDWGEKEPEKEKALARIITCFRLQSEELDLSGLGLESLPIGMMKGLKKLKSLDCSNNKLTTLPPEVGEIVNINIKNNPLTGVVSLLPAHYAHRIEVAVSAFDDPHSKEDLKIKRKWVCNQTLLSLYGLLYEDNPAACLEKRPIVVSGYATAGLGDYYQVLATANILYEKFGLPVHVFMKIENLSERRHKLSLPDPEKVILTLVDANDTITEEEEKKITRNSSIVIDTPYSKNGIKTCDIKIHEYDRAESYSVLRGVYFMNLFMDNNNGKDLSMGLGEYKLGITLKNPDMVGDLTSLQDKDLKGLLLSDKKGDQKYEDTHRMIYGYLYAASKDDSASRKGALDLYPQFFANSMCRALSEDPHSIDLICPFVRILDENWPEKEDTHLDFDIDVLKSSGVQKIQLFKKNNDKELVLKEEVNTGLEKGKTLRLINPFPLSNMDAQVLTKASYRYVGCQGDLSLSECLSYGKLPWYQIERHKKSLYKSLYNVAAPLPVLKKYFYAMGRIHQNNAAYKSGVNETLVWSPLEETMKDVNIESEIKEFTRNIKDGYDFNKVVVDLVYQFRGEKKFPSLGTEKLLEDYVENTKSLEECYHIFKCKIEHAKLGNSRENSE
ncbi:MAG: hypothetical protein V4489_01900 [Chlamydiota bacterium]